MVAVVASTRKVDVVKCSEAAVILAACGLVLLQTMLVDLLAVVLVKL